MVRDGIASAWRQSVTASQRKNGDKFLFGNRGEKRRKCRKVSIGLQERLHNYATAPAFFTYHTQPRWNQLRATQPGAQSKLTCVLAWLLLLSGVVREESDIDKIKWQTWVHGKCNQTWLESRTRPPLSEQSGSVPLISSHWTGLSEWQPTRVFSLHSSWPK